MESTMLNQIDPLHQVAEIVKASPELIRTLEDCPKGSRLFFALVLLLVMVPIVCLLLALNG